METSTEHAARLDAEASALDDIVRWARTAKLGLITSREALDGIALALADV